jgi:hypothetical protein
MPNLGLGVGKRFKTDLPSTLGVGNQCGAPVEIRSVEEASVLIEFSREVLMRRLVLISTLAGTVVSSGSVAAAQNPGSQGPTTRNAAFIGAQARVSFGRSNVSVPVARLTAGMSNVSFNAGSSLVNRRISNTFELGWSRNGRADFYVGGQRYSDMKAKLGIAPVGIALLAVGGIAVVGAAVAAGADEKEPEVVCMGIGVCPPLPKPGG